MSEKILNVLEVYVYYTVLIVLKSNWTAVGLCAMNRIQVEMKNNYETRTIDKTKIVFHPNS